MADIDRASPLAGYGWLAEAGWVFAMHSVQLWADPFTARARLADLWAEKQGAMAEGVHDASIMALRGGTLNAIADAAIGPVRHRVRTNAAKIMNG